MCNGRGFVTEVYNYRMALRMTQEDLGKKIGKSARTIQRYESGDTPTPILVFNAVKKLFDDEVNEQ
jgi:transcriptional regulator with XRE-family HTH domain